jgi:hypothetical protein
MAHVVDTRAAGGEFVVIGEALVLPYSETLVEPGVEPLIGSLRYNPSAVPYSEAGPVSGGRIEVYLPSMTVAGQYFWDEIGVSREMHRVMYSDGATMTGDLKMTNAAQILLDDGTLNSPGLSFLAAPSTGLYRDPISGQMNIAIQGVNIVNVSPTQVDVNGMLTALNARIAGDMTSSTAHIDKLYANYGDIIVIDNDTLTSNVGFIGHATSNLINVVPAAGDDPQAASEVVLTAAGTDWIMGHDPFTSRLTFTYQGGVILTLTPDDSLITNNIYAKNITATNIKAVTTNTTTLNAKTINTETINAQTMNTDTANARTVNAERLNSNVAVINDVQANTVESAISISTRDLLASRSVTTSALTANASVTTTDLLASRSVTTSALTANATITTTDLTASRSVTTADVYASNSVQTKTLIAQNVNSTGTMQTTDLVASNSVTTRYLVANTSLTTPTVSATYITAQNITTTDLSSVTVEASTSVTTPAVNTQAVVTSTVTATTTITARTSISAPTMTAGTAMSAPAITAGVSMAAPTITATTINATVLNVPTINATSVTVTQGSLCEIYNADQVYPIGTVMIAGGQYEVTQSTGQADARQVGVVGSSAGVMMGDAPAMPGSAAVAICVAGRSLCNVIGNVTKGDLLISSNSVGCAMTAPNSLWGADIIGRALGNYTSTNDANGNPIPGQIMIKVA